MCTHIQIYVLKCFYFQIKVVSFPLLDNYRRGNMFCYPSSNILCVFLRWNKRIKDSYIRYWFIYTYDTKLRIDRVRLPQACLRFDWRRACTYMLSTNQRLDLAAIWQDQRMRQPHDNFSWDLLWEKLQNYTDHCLHSYARLHYKY